MASKTSPTKFLLLLALVIASSCEQTSPCDNPRNPMTPMTLGSAFRAQASCPRDALKLGVCAKILGLTGVVVGDPVTQPCCTLLAGLIDLEAAMCLCSTIKADVLGLNLGIPVSLSLLLGLCGRTLPTGFICA